jgi:hypothetical protein
LAWKKEEIKYLKSNFTYLSDTKLSKQLNISQNAVRIQASRLNLRKLTSLYRENFKFTFTEIPSLEP